MKRIRRLAVLVAGALVVVGSGCSNGGDAPGGEEVAAAPAATQAPEADSAPAPAPATSNLWRNGEAVPLDVQVPHPSGVILQLTSLQSRPMETVIGMKVLNGRDREVHLNRFNSRRAYIVMGTGERLYISPPPSNTDLTIPGGQSMEGELVFLGRLPLGQGATLILNDNGSTDSTSTSTPKFQIELPVSGGDDQAAS